MAYRAAVLITILSLLLVAGCGSKVSQENYERIQTGMTLEQVQEILGKGQLQEGIAGGVGNLAGSASVYQWQDGHRSITITFVNNKVTAKSSQNLATG